MGEEDQLMQLWRKLGQEIKEAEADLEVRRTALEAKRAKFKTLDDARAVIVAETTATDAAIQVVLGNATSASVLPSLQEAVRRYVCESRSPDGLSAGEVANALRKIGYGKGKGRSFYATVYVSLLRLADKDDISIITSEKGPRRFARREDQTRPLFSKVEPARGGLQ